MNFSFSGCGFLGIYHVGVAAALQKFAPNVIANAKFSGASAGSLAAVVLVCDSQLGAITSTVLKTVQEARTRLLGPFSPTFSVEKILREGLFSVLPRNAHEIVNGRVSISVTRMCDGRNILLTKFDSFEDLIQALLCSSFIPGFSGWMPLKIKGVRYVDGGFTNNLPTLNSNTVTVSPFSGEADICPKDKSSGIMSISLANTNIEMSKENLYRFSYIVWPPPLEVMNKMCQQGFNDTLDFLQRNYMINCMRCVAVHSTINDEHKIKRKYYEKRHEDKNCQDCNLQKEEALLDDLPEAVGSLLKDALDSANDQLSSWAFKDNSRKLLSLIKLPFIVPKEFGYLMFHKLRESKDVMSNIRDYAAKIIQLLKVMYRSWILREKSPLPHHYHSKHKNHDEYSCQLEITEFTGDVSATPNGDSRQKFDFSLGLNETLSPTEITSQSVIENEMLSNLALRCAARSLGKQAIRSRNASRVASRVASRAVSRIPSLEDVSVQSIECEDFNHHIKGDAFSKIIDVTNQQTEAIMTYYYTNENDEMKVTEIFDISQSLEIEHEKIDDSSSFEEQLQSLPDTHKLSKMYANSTEGESTVVDSMSEPEVDQQCLS